MRNVLSPQEYKFINAIHQRIASKIGSTDPFLYWFKNYILVYSGDFQCPPDLKYPASSLRSKLAWEHRDPIKLLDLVLSHKLLGEVISCLSENVDLTAAQGAQKYLEQAIEEKLRIRKVRRQNDIIMISPLIVLLIVSLAIAKGYLDKNFLVIAPLLMLIGSCYRDTRISYSNILGMTQELENAFTQCNRQIAQLAKSLPNPVVSMIDDEFKKNYQSTITELNQQPPHTALKVQGKFFHTLRIMQQTEQAASQTAEHTCAVCLDEFKDQFADAYYSSTKTDSPQESPYQGPYHKSCLVSLSIDPLNRRGFITDPVIGLPVLNSLANSLAEFKELESKNPLTGTVSIKLENGSIRLQARSEPDLESGSDSTLVKRQPRIWNTSNSKKPKPNLPAPNSMLSLD